MIIVLRSIMPAVVGLAAVARDAEVLVVPGRIIRRAISRGALIMITDAETVRYALWKSGGSGIIQHTDGRVRVDPLRIVSSVVSRSEEHTSELQSRGHLV